ncbi:hypothetical protein RM533_06205 [Croceicoccus sp. F390]|uniref:Glycerophosphoryl diester phosphodiesterase membrane domain-containing protein n=1 Tax=Croceicoccus esteveae TaxID=3075597 RepID=A0ABU2ZJP2_9SPHN|nr:hypothetical protein [Croceicoccus sp. F390]MDT0575774.1 hypothetical protein [Croceicoccus sp. F390]
MAIPPERNEPARARFVAGPAWNRASSMIAANREMLLVLAGVFFLLPQLIVTFALPAVPAGLEGEALAEAIGDTYLAWWPLLLGSLIVQALGLLAVVALLADPARPTVAEAVRRGTAALPTYIAAQLVVVAGVGLLMLLVLLPFGFTGNAGIVAIGTGIAFAAALYMLVRLSLLAPVIIAANLRNPFDALQHAWTLTRGQAGRLLFFLMMLSLAALVIYMVASIVPGLLVLPIAGADTAALVVGLIGSVVAAAYSLILVAVLTSIWFQLAQRPG